MRWVFSDGGSSDTYTFERNPSEMRSLIQPHHTSAMRSNISGVLLLRKPPAPQPWEFKGTLISKTMYDALLLWSNKNNIFLTDHRGDVHEIVPIAFEPTPARPRNTRFTYTFRALYVRRVS